jgi:hypothetical protein
MKALPKILLALTTVAALSVAYPAKANLITNGGFETGDFTGWTFSNAVVVGMFAGVPPHSGSFEAELGAPAVISQSVATTPGQSYTIDFFAAAAGINTLPLTMTVNFGGTVFIHIFTASTGYTEFMFNATVPSSAASLSFSTDAFGFLLLDDISVTPTTVPDGGTTVSLLGCALLGLAGLRRRLSC